MPYEYRKLTRAQREEIIAQRKALGYPLLAPLLPFREAGYYLLTAANYEHVHVINTAERRAEIDESAWSALYTNTSIPFEKPKSGKIVVKVINHYGDEMLEVYEV